MAVQKGSRAVLEVPKGEGRWQGEGGLGNEGGDGGGGGVTKKKVEEAYAMKKGKVEDA